MPLASAVIVGSLSVMGWDRHTHFAGRLQGGEGGPGDTRAVVTALRVNVGSAVCGHAALGDVPSLFALFSSSAKLKTSLC